jgi:Na+-driven multidrug efflux pump
MEIFLQIGVVSGLALSAGLYTSFSNIARLFTSDPVVLMVVKSCSLFVCASQPINALAFIFDGLHYGVSDFDYVAQATVWKHLSLFFLYFILISLSSFGYTDCCWDNVIISFVICSICFWTCWSLGWFDNTYGIAHGFGHSQASMEIRTLVIFA